MARGNIREAFLDGAGFDMLERLSLNTAPGFRVWFVCFFSWTVLVPEFELEPTESHVLSAILCGPYPGSHMITN